jgi:hypothetical protein
MSLAGAIGDEMNGPGSFLLSLTALQKVYMMDLLDTVGLWSMMAQAFGIFCQLWVSNSLTLPGASFLRCQYYWSCIHKRLDEESFHSCNRLVLSKIRSS